MKFRFPYRTIRKFHGSDAFSFAPSALSIHFAQTRKLSDRRADCERLIVPDVTANFEEHYSRILSVGSFGRTHPSSSPVWAGPRKWLN